VVAVEAWYLLHIQVEEETVIHLTGTGEIVHQSDNHLVLFRFYDPTALEVTDVATASANAGAVAGEQATPRGREKCFSCHAIGQGLAGCAIA